MSCGALSFPPVFFFGDAPFSLSVAMLPGPFFFKALQGFPPHVLKIHPPVDGPEESPPAATAPFSSLYRVRELPFSPPEVRHSPSYLTSLRRPPFLRWFSQPSRSPFQTRFPSKRFSVFTSFDAPSPSAFFEVLRSFVLRAPLFITQFNEVSLIVSHHKSPPDAYESPGLRRSILPH